jgi:hypothetical protein
MASNETRLFDVAKVGCFLDTIQHSTEDRRGEATKIVVLTLRVDPLDAKLALALDERVRQTLFNLSSAEPHKHIRRVEFALGIPRQNLEVFASPDTAQATIAFLQVEAKSVKVRIDKDKNHYSLICKVSFGPIGPDELAYIEEWRNTQRFVTFRQAEPSMDFGEQQPAA